MIRGQCAFAGTFLPVSSFIPGVSLASTTLPRRALVVPRPASNPRPFTSAPAIVSAQKLPAIIRPVVPSTNLLDFVEDKAQFRFEILKSLSAYVRKQNLQDPTNKRVVLCDEKLKNLFGVDQCTILEMNKYITPHVQKPEDVGGKYVQEAKDAMEAYLIEKKKTSPNQKPTEPVRKKRSKQTSSTAKDDQKAGRKLFKPVILSKELSAICRSRTEMPRQEIVKAVWEYIRLNDLQGPAGTPIKCDFLLKKVYNADEIDVKTIMKGIGAHVTKKP